MPKCMTEEEARSWLRENRPYIELIEGGWGGRTGVHSMFRCLREGCGHVWPAKFNNIKSGYGCPKCAGHILLTENEARDWLRMNKPNIVIAENGWGGGASKLSRFKCTNPGCGYEWSAKFANVKHKGGCHRCSGRMLLSEESARAWLSENRPNIGLVDGGWGGSATARSVFCCQNNSCGCCWEQRFTLIKQGYGCPECGALLRASHRSLSERDAVQWLVKNRPSIALIPNGYAGSASGQSKFMCLKEGCGHKWETSFINIKRVKGCPHCTPCTPHAYLYNGIRFDSSWEFIYYLDMESQGKKLTRIVAHRDAFLLYDHEGTTHRWYPDFIYNDTYIEVKPDNGGWYAGSAERTAAKRAMGHNVVFIGDKEIKQSAERVRGLGINIEDFAIKS